MSPQQTIAAPDGRFASRARKIDRDRHRKLQQLQLQGYEPFPEVHLPSRLLATEINARHDPRELLPGVHDAWRYAVAGRVLARRKHRHATFIDLRDQSGTIELCVKPEQLADARCAQLRRADVGDIVYAHGAVYVTDNRRLTLLIDASKLLAKALRPPPGAHLVAPSESQRALDLLANERTRAIFRARAAMTGALREWMAEHSFIEVEGPILQRSSDGVSLRDSSRLHLRRCLLGGFERVYELGRCAGPARSRSPLCSPERTVLEWAAAYADHVQAARQTEQLILRAAEAVSPRMSVRRSARLIDFSGPWRTITVREGIQERCGLDIFAADASALAAQSRLTRGSDASWDSVVLALYRNVVEPSLTQPTIVCDFPLADQPLARRHPAHARLASSFRVVIGGIEVASGDSELNDPRERWDRLSRTAASSGERERPISGDEEVRLLEYGQYPAAGAQLHIDRLLMLLTESSSVQEVIPFPRTVGGLG